MKVVLYFIIWFPVSFILVIFSLYLLISNKGKFYNKINSTLTINNIESDDAIIINKNISPENDIRFLALKRFFEEYNSPLKDHVHDLIKQADIWGLDYKLIPAIAMQESKGCKYIPPDSYNCWGFGIYGSRVTKFPSYKDAIMRIAQVIKEAYIKEGLTNPTLLEDRWAPPSRGQWSYAVNLFMSKIYNYESSMPAS